MKEDNIKQIKRDRQIWEAYELHESGYSHAKIGAKLGICSSSATNYIWEAHRRLEETSIQNLNYRRQKKITQLETLTTKCYEDMEDAELKPADLLDLSDYEISQAKAASKRAISFLRQEILKYTQEIAKLEGLYDTDRVEKHIQKKETNNFKEVSSLDDSDLMSIFNDIQRSK